VFYPKLAFDGTMQRNIESILPHRWEGKHMKGERHGADYLLKEY
jgi:hypothetical protein